MLLFPNAHEIAQMAQFHSIPPRYQTDQNTILDVSRVIIGRSRPDMKALVLKGPEHGLDFEDMGSGR
jgi:hypothetical protein